MKYNKKQKLSVVREITNNPKLTQEQLDIADGLLEEAKKIKKENPVLKDNKEWQELINTAFGVLFGVVDNGE